MVKEMAFSAALVVWWAFLAWVLSSLPSSTISFGTYFAFLVAMALAHEVVRSRRKERERRS